MVLTRTAWLLVLTLAVLVALSIVGPAGGVFIALAVVLFALVAAALPAGPSARSQARSDPGAEAARRHERERGWR